jgi:DNA polymerase IV
MLPPPSNKLIVHVDMNSYFASVEQQANPFLRGKPIGVCAYLHQYGCVIAASIEAKRLGMKVGMSVEEAKEAVPQAIFVQNDPAKYRAITSRVFGLLHELTDRVEHYSIDEAFLDLTGWYRDAAEAAWALTRVRRRIRDEVGEWLRCSVGIAPTRFLAKTASDMEKPNGLVIIDRNNLDEMLAQLDLEDVCGIGPRIRRRLERMGIRNLLEVKRYPVGNLMRVFGKYGLFLWCKLHAMEFEKLTEPDTLPKSVGHSFCVPLRVNRDRTVVPTLMKLTERAGRRMRRLGLLANTVSVAVGFRGPGFSSPNGPFWQPLVGEGGGISTHLDEPAQDSFTLVGTACDLLREIWHDESVNFLAVTLSDLMAPSNQMRLDHVGVARRAPAWNRERDRRRRASAAVDLVRDRYGDEAICFGEMMRLTGDEAPDRIGFRKTEGVDVVM